LGPAGHDSRSRWYTYKAKLEIKTGYETKETALGKVTLNAEDQGVAAGQFAVFYQDERCLGCAVIQ
jgi:tRNA U34 2-thiouridine synthase MnmA/TrmU